MKSKKILTIGAVILLAVFLALSVMFLLASAPPSDYHPIESNHQRQKETVRQLKANHLMPFLNSFSDVGPFTFEITEDDLNRYLASLDMIAYQRMGSSGKEKSGGVYKAMDAAGLAGPFIKFNDGFLTFMLRTKTANKVVSVDLAFDADDQGQMIVDLKQIRVGRMPVPQFLVNHYIDQLQDSVQELLDKNKDVSDFTKLSDGRGLELLLAKIILALDGEAFPTDLTILKQTKHTHRVDIGDGKLTLHIAPTIRE